MSLPLKITPEPIVDALVEIRFVSSTHANAVFGILFNILKTEFPKVESLPILQIPESVRIADANLKFKPHYKVSNENFVVQIGPDLLSISSFPKYAGWDSFSDKIFQILDVLNSTDIVDSIIRLGLRYVNFFDDNIFENIKLDIKLANSEISKNKTIFKTEIDHGNFNSTLQIANNAIHGTKFGSVIDIDTFKLNDLSNFFSDKEDIINTAHSTEKELFYSLLKEKYLKSLKPVY